MKRRNLLKNIGLTSLGMVGLHPQISAAELPEIFAPDEKKDPAFEQFGRTDAEIERDAKLFKDQFFTKNELKTLAILVDIIIPADGKSGSATDAGVPDFIEFMAKDRIELQTPLRGGLRWLDAQATKRFAKAFVEISPKQRLEIIDDIAYPNRKIVGMSQGVTFFNLARNLTATGFWSSKMGISDIGYVGNVPNNWDGPPAEVLAQFGF
jgi:gluconate 2-dehydrogenase gamma chain